MNSGWKVAAIVGGLLLVVALVLGAFGLGLRAGQIRAGLVAPYPRPGAPALGPGWIGWHGAMGVVEQVDLQARTLAIVSPAGDRLVLRVDGDTIVERYHERIDLAAIQVGERVVCLGRPDSDGQIVARVIRVLGPAPEGAGNIWGLFVRLAWQAIRLLPLPFHQSLPGE